MPIILQDSIFTDSYNQQFKVFTANAGDSTTCKFTVLEDISIITTSTTFFNINSLDRTIALSGNNASFLKEGFRVGDTIKFNSFDGNDKLVVDRTTTILSLTDTLLNYSSDIGLFHGFANSSTTWLIYKSTTRDSFNLSLNFIPDSNNTDTQSLGSLIDSEETRFGTQTSSLNVLPVNGVTNLISSGKKSGNFAVTDAKVTRKANITRISSAPLFVTKKYEIEFRIVNPNILFSTRFKANNCLKLVASMKFSLSDTDSLPTELYYRNNANTGWFDEPYNSGTPYSELTSLTMPTLYYNVDSTNSINFNATVKNSNFTIYNGFEIGACYVTLSDYNKNKKDNQSVLLSYGSYKYTYGAVLPTPSLDCIVKIDLNSVVDTTVGADKISVINGDIYFDATKTAFFEGKTESDRRLIIWVKSANVNHIIYDGLLQKKMPVGKEITPITNYYIQENNNTTYADVTQTPANSQSPYSCNIQDNVNLFSDFTLLKSDVNSSITAKIVAVKGDLTAILDEFVLDEMAFGLNQQDWDVWGTLYSDRQYNLPSASSKKQGFLKLKATVDANTKSFRLSYPVMINWRYWLNEPNASNIFIGNNTNNKNWRNYSKDTLSYKTYYKLEIERNGVFDFKYQLISFWEYNETGVFTSTIQIYDADTNTELTSMIIGKKIKIKATHVYNINFINTGWGDIMIETTESNPSWLLSSVVPHQTNTQNPLYPITGTTATYTTVNATTRTIECYLDTSKLVGTSFTISSKICDEAIVIVQETFKITEDGVDKFTENSLNKIIE
jgi:hypothetical protein